MLWKLTARNLLTDESEECLLLKRLVHKSCETILLVNNTLKRIILSIKTEERAIRLISSTDIRGLNPKEFKLWTLFVFSSVNMARVPSPIHRIFTSVLSATLILC